MHNCDSNIKGSAGQIYLSFHLEIQLNSALDWKYNLRQFIIVHCLQMNFKNNHLIIFEVF